MQRSWMGCAVVCLILMRHARIKIPKTEALAIYHCSTRTVNKERLFDDTAKEVLRRHIWQVADYCGVQILTYTILDNHFHVEVHVPQWQPVPDAELLRRYRVLYPKPTKYQAARLEVIEWQLAQNGPDAVEWRKRQCALMGDVSQYMKLLKQRFTIWFNKAHERIGTLWAERFKSTLLENSKNVVQTVAAYIDLNCVRAGLVIDPKDYRFCGYAEAVAGNEVAQAGLRFVIPDETWADVQAQYRQLLFGTGAGARDAAMIPVEELQRVMAQGGRLPLAAVLRCRIRYFTDGAVLGSRAHVEACLAKYRVQTGRRRNSSPRELPVWTDWGDLTSLRGLRRNAIG